MDELEAAYGLAQLKHKVKAKDGPTAKDIMKFADTNKDGKLDMDEAMTALNKWAKKNGVKLSDKDRKEARE